MDEKGIKRESEAMYYALEDNALLHTFSKRLSQEGVYGNPNTFVCNAHRVLFNGKPVFSSRKTYRKYRRIIDIYRKFKTEEGL